MDDGNTAGGQDDVGRSYLATQQPLGQIFGGNRPILAPSLPFPDAASFRLIPSASAIFRLVRVADGDMSGDQDDDVGGAYLENQHALGQICGGNRPILVLIMPFFASVSFRQLP